jgi:hypothetical protein
MPSVAVMGMSWGGIANLFAAARDSRIDALVGLDGSLREFPGLVKTAPGVHLEGMTLPLLAFVQRHYSLETLDQDGTPALNDGPNVFNAWTHGDLVFIGMLGLNHGFLSSAFPRNDDV